MPVRVVAVLAVLVVALRAAARAWRRAVESHRAEVAAGGRQPCLVVPHLGVPVRPAVGSRLGGAPAVPAVPEAAVRRSAVAVRRSLEEVVAHQEDRAVVPLAVLGAVAGLAALVGPLTAADCQLAVAPVAGLRLALLAEAADLVASPVVQVASPVVRAEPPDSLARPGAGVPVVAVARLPLVVAEAVEPRRQLGPSQEREVRPVVVPAVGGTPEARR